MEVFTIVVLNVNLAAIINQRNTLILITIEIVDQNVNNVNGTQISIALKIPKYPLSLLTIHITISYFMIVKNFRQNTDTSLIMFLKKSDSLLNMETYQSPLNESY